MSTDVARATPGWLVLREPADAAARSVSLVDQLGRHLSLDRPVVVHDLGAGTGSMARWLAPLLPGPQRWVLHDRDVDLLAAVGDAMPGDAAVETRSDDITRLPDDELGDASLLTASALLDMFTSTELSRFVGSCARARCPVLLCLSVTGRAELAPADPLDPRIQSAFNAHQQRVLHGEVLLGPAAADRAAEEFRRLGHFVTVRQSPWHLGPDQADLISAWLTGWVGAAVEQDPDLAEAATAYLQRRLQELADGRLHVTVHHDDLLAVPQ